MLQLYSSQYFTYLLGILPYLENYTLDFTGVLFSQLQIFGFIMYMYHSVRLLFFAKLFPVQPELHVDVQVNDESAC